MDRLKRPGEGFTLVELIIAIVLSTVVFLSVSNLLINFGNFSANLVKSEASLMGTALGVFEEITGKITAANKVCIPSSDAAMDVPAVAYPSGCAGNSCIQIRVSPTGAATGVHTGDTVYTYWQSGTQIYESIGAAAGNVIAKDILANSLSFVYPDATNLNRITVTLEAQATRGTTTGATKEHLVTTAIMRSRSAA